MISLNCHQYNKTKTTLKFSLSKSEWKPLGKYTKLNAGENNKKRGITCCCWDYKLVQRLWKSIWRPLEKLDKTYYS